MEAAEELHINGCPPLRMALTGSRAFLCFWNPVALHGPVFSGNSIRKDRGVFFPSCPSHLDQKSQLSSSTNPVKSTGSKSDDRSSPPAGGPWGLTLTASPLTSRPK